MVSRWVLLALLGISSGTIAGESNHTPGAMQIIGERNFLTGYPATVRDGIINVVVEIPAGTNEKWEASADGTSIQWEIRDGKPRVVQYLPYPGNYGLVPGTLLSKDKGGDGDPVDVIVLGSAVTRGSVIEAVPIGVLALLDGGEQDDKILAVPLSGPMSEVTDLEMLDSNYPGVSELVETWFTRYKRGEMQSLGYRDAAVAWRLIQMTSAEFSRGVTCSRSEE